MKRGYGCGNSEARAWEPSVGAFVNDEGGYTTVAVALALLVCLVLVFSAASAGWVQARAAEVQEVADASAMAGANCVAAFSTVSQVLDACVLSLGVVGVLLYGAGLVVAAIPFVQEGSPQIIKAAHEVLDARRDFARSAAQGLSRLESALPALIAMNSASCVAANATHGIGYVGCALPCPATSQSDYSFLERDVDGDELEEAAERLREASQRKEDAERRARDARERAWRADCVDDPSCLRSRAASLAGLSGAANPSYASVDAWRFGYALVRARNYYGRRAVTETPGSASSDELTRSAAREAFYDYAYDALRGAICEEEGTRVRIDLPELPHTSAMVRGTRLYTQGTWPCSIVEGTRTLHSCTACPAYGAEASGHASLADLEAGAVARCPVCGMDVEVQGNVADASTNISNGFEHYWRIVVRESRTYVEAKREAAEAEEEMRALAEEGSDAFQEAIDALSVDRPKLCPPGAWGCVAIVAREGGVSTPTELVSAFSSAAELPAGVAIAAATLAPDNATDGNDVLSRVFDGVGERGALVGLAGNVCALWGKLLVAYGSGYESVSGATDGLLEGIGSLLGEQVAAWLKGKLSSIVKVTGFEPADMRLRKPVIVHTQQVLDQDGRTAAHEVREVIEALPGTQAELVDVNWGRVAQALGVDEVTIAEMPVPGMPEVRIPLTLDVPKLLGAS